MNREVALSVLGFLDMPAPDFVEIAAEAGFDAVSLRVAGGEDASPGELRNSHDVTETVRRLDATGVGVIDVEVLRLGPRLGRPAISRALDLASALGARHMLSVDAGWGARDPLVAQLLEIQELAGRDGPRPCLEFMRFSRCRDLPTAVEAARDAGVGVLVDVLHLFRSGGDAARVAEVVDLHGPDIFPYAQLCDAAAGVPDGGDLRDEAIRGRLLPGQGVLPLAEVLDALPPGAPLAVEAPTSELQAMPPQERAHTTMQATRAFLETESLIRTKG